jgi:hypothetical protein
VPIGHLGLNVPDVEPAGTYFDEFLPMVGYVQEWEVGYSHGLERGTALHLSGN